MASPFRQRVCLSVSALLISLTLPGMLGARHPAPAPSTVPSTAPSGRPLLLVHYMPWFESKPLSGVWGWHWTMNKFDPERVVGPDGRREIASHYYPLIGPYDSADPDVLEYHTLLMRVAGIDGIVADWYGTNELLDYPVIHRRTQLLFDAARRRGLWFGVCYEDRVLQAHVEQRKATVQQALGRAQADLRYCAQHWFNDPHYLRWDGRPLLLLFGQDYLSTAEQWRQVFGALGDEAAWPALFAQRPIPGVLTGTFAWPPMWKSVDGMLTRAVLDDYLDEFYSRDHATIGAAFPGFHDIYAEADLHQSYGRLDDAAGDTLRHTLARAVKANVPMIQLITWNDFGEGTMLEPTREQGYRSLEIIQQARHRMDPRFPFQPADLRLPLRIYELRKQSKGDAERAAGLDRAADALTAGDPATARRALTGAQ